MSKIDDLIAAYNAAYHSRHDDQHRAGIAAVVRALRDDMRYMMINRDSIDDMFDKILGDAGEKVAQDPLPHLSEREKALFVAALKGDAGPITPPATDPAPAVCVWTQNARGWWVASCDKRYSFRKTARQKLTNCQVCNTPIKFTEAK